MNFSIRAYNNSLSDEEVEIADLLVSQINITLPQAESKIWHRHPVWFLDGNPIVGYSKLKRGIRPMFWSGMGFDEEVLQSGIYYYLIQSECIGDKKGWLTIKR